MCVCVCVQICIGLRSWGTGGTGGKPYPPLQGIGCLFVVGDVVCLCVSVYVCMCIYVHMGSITGVLGVLDLACHSPRMVMDAMPCVWKDRVWMHAEPCF